MQLFSSKQLIAVNNFKIENVLALNKRSISKKYFKYFIGYVNHFDDYVKPWVIRVPRLTG